MKWYRRYRRTVYTTLCATLRRAILFCMIMHKPPSEHEEWLEENQKPKKREERDKKPLPKQPPNNQPSGADQRWQALKDDIQEYG